jgi:hypothetical protein
LEVSLEQFNAAATFEKIANIISVTTALEAHRGSGAGTTIMAALEVEVEAEAEAPLEMREVTAGPSLPASGALYASALDPSLVVSVMWRTRPRLWQTRQKGKPSPLTPAGYGCCSESRLMHASRRWMHPTPCPCLLEVVETVLMVLLSTEMTTATMVEKIFGRSLGAARTKTPHLLLLNKILQQ